MSQQDARNAIVTLHLRRHVGQVAVTIVEARQLSGPNINPCVEVRVGDRVKKTEIQMSTNSPYYNQVGRR